MSHSIGRLCWSWLYRSIFRRWIYP